jgi:ribosomal protein L3
MKNLLLEMDDFRKKLGFRKSETGGAHSGWFKISIPGTVLSRTPDRVANCRVYECEQYRLIQMTMICRKRHLKGRRWLSAQPTTQEIGRIREMFFEHKDQVVMRLPGRTLREVRDFKMVEIWEAVDPMAPFPPGDYKLDRKNFKIILPEKP